MLHQQQLTHRKSSNVLKTVQWINFLNKSLKIRAGDWCSNNTIILAKLDNPHRLYLLRNNLFYMIPLFVLGQTIFPCNRKYCWTFTNNKVWNIKRIQVPTCTINNKRHEFNHGNKPVFSAWKSVPYFLSAAGKKNYTQ